MLRSVAKSVLPDPLVGAIALRMEERANRRRVIDLSGARALRDAPVDALREEERLVTLLAEGGLNDEHLEQFPAHLHPYCGKGLRLWQLPNQFAPYLIEVARHGVRRYLEIGVRHGGSFAATVEYLSRVGELDEAWRSTSIRCRHCCRIRSTSRRPAHAGRHADRALRDLG